MPEPRLSTAVLDATSRRGFLARAGRLVLAVAGGSALAASLRTQSAEAYHFCGHVYTTGSCPHPTGLPRVDRNGFPLRASDGHRVDDLGRPVNAKGYPVGAHGHVLRDADGHRLPPAPRTRVCVKTGRSHGFKAHYDGTWHRCCHGHIRKLIDCCGYVQRRINGDGALTGYCYRGRKVFCVTYYDTHIRC